MDIKEIKTKREAYERKIEDILRQFAKELPPEISIDSAVAIVEAWVRVEIRYNVV
jgi:RNase P/RNase MRP subunit p30